MSKLCATIAHLHQVFLCLLRRNDESLHLEDSQWLGGYVEEIGGQVGQMDADAVELVEGAKKPWRSA